MSPADRQGSTSATPTLDALQEVAQALGRTFSAIAAQASGASKPTQADFVLTNPTPKESK